MKHSKLEIALLTISVVFVVVMLIVPWCRSWSIRWPKVGSSTSRP